MESQAHDPLAGDPGELRPTLTLEGPGGLWRTGEPPAAPLPRGAAVGRYLIADVLGMGGMGVVYTGVDPDLGRKVAVKLLRPDRQRREGGEAARLRLLREAQAIARLSHPNVVAVYDVGAWGDQLFVAMELVEGQTLRAWLAAAKRPRREIVERFVAAGRGLAAAHAAGLVHRDFKPDNVLLGDDGRVLVADFGLARLSGETEESPGAAESPMAAPLTGGGVLLGTPAYMAPEQRRGEAADARSDQFSFTVALYEALAGANPLDGRQGAGEDGRADLSALDGARLPSRLKRLLQRGLAQEPATRYPSMTALLADLAPASARAHRRHLQWVAGLGLLALGIAAYAGTRAQRGQLCRGGESAAAQAWGEAPKRALLAAFRTSGVEYAEASFAGVAGLLDRYTRDWTVMHRSACEATRLHGEQSEELLDRRMFCLSQRLGEVRALSELLARPGAPGIERAVDAALGLTPLATCADVAVLAARLPPPRDPARTGGIAVLQRRLAEAEALERMGREREALAHLGDAAGRALALGFKPLEAEVLYELAYLRDRLGESAAAEPLAWEALTAALAGRDAKLAALIASQLSWIVGRSLDRPEEARRWDELAQGIAGGGSGSASLSSLVLLRSASRLDQAGRYSEAVAVLERALAISEPALGSDSPQVANLLNNLAASLSNLGRFDESAAAARKCLAIRQKRFGNRHPGVGEAYSTLGGAYWGKRRLDLAAENFGRAVAIFDASYGARHPYTLGTRGNLASVLRDLGRPDEALAELQEVLAGFEAPPHPEPRFAAIALTQIGDLLVTGGRAQEALAAYERALAIDEKILGPNHPSLAYDLQGQGLALWKLGRDGEAVPPLERAVALRERQLVSPVLLAASRFYLARAVERQRRHSPRALELAHLARKAYAAAGDAAAVEDVDAWLATVSKIRKGGP